MMRTSSTYHLYKIALLVKTDDAVRDSVILRCDEPSRALYFIVSGTVEVIQVGAGLHDEQLQRFSRPWRLVLCSCSSYPLLFFRPQCHAHVPLLWSMSCGHGWNGGFKFGFVLCIVCSMRVSAVECNMILDLLPSDASVLMPCPPHCKFREFFGTIPRHRIDLFCKARVHLEFFTIARFRDSERRATRFHSPFLRARRLPWCCCVAGRRETLTLFSCLVLPQLKKKRIRNRTTANTGNAAGTANVSGNGGGVGAGGGAGGAGGNPTTADSPRERDGAGAEFVYKV